MDWGVISGRRSLRWKRFWKCEVLLNFPVSILTGECGGYIIINSKDSKNRREGDMKDDAAAA